jgi:uncharacterized protein YjbI with pentapeptide repeats
MGLLLTDHQLRNSNPSETAASDKTVDASLVARAQTLAVLEGLGRDQTRKRIVLQFLYDSALINGYEPVVGLDGANLSWADLSNFDLNGTSLHGANLESANFRGAVLSQTDLSSANLC